MGEWIAGFYLAVQERTKIKIPNIKEYMKKTIYKEDLRLASFYNAGYL